MHYVIKYTDKRVRNHAGAESFQLTPEKQFKHFLILGSAVGTYYVTQKELLKENLNCLQELIDQGKGKWAVDLIVEIATERRAVSTDPALFALAYCCAAKDQELRAYACGQIEKVVKTGTQLFHFVQYVKQFRSFGRMLKRALRNWYEGRSPAELTYQVLKYQSRDGWAHRDLLRMLHIKPSESHQHIYQWIVKGTDPGDGRIHAVEIIKKEDIDGQDIVQLIEQYNLVHENIPTHKRSEEVWKALLQRMPVEATVRELATLTRNNVFKDYDMVQVVLNRLQNPEYAKVHPIKILAALHTYGNGKGFRSDATWTPVPDIKRALETAFYQSFAQVRPTGKNILLAVDVSFSMHGSTVNGIPGMRLHVAAGAMAMLYARVEPHSQFLAVDTQMYPMAFPKDAPLEQIIEIFARMGGGGTDLSLPFEYILKCKIPVDLLIILTDNETWAHRREVHKVLEEYRRKVHKNIKVVEIQMTSTSITNMPPADTQALTVAGFDTRVPDIITQFVNDGI